MVPMFQESDEKVFPVILIDQHHQSPITQLFVAYDSSRKMKTQSKGLNPSQFNPQAKRGGSLLENGGHLISVSEDGTIAVTNLNSGEIHKALHNFTPNDKDKSRANQFI